MNDISQEANQTAAEETPVTLPGEPLTPAEDDTPVTEPEGPEEPQTPVDVSQIANQTAHRDGEPTEQP